MKIGSSVNAKILSIDIEKGRIALGLKQLIRDYYEEFLTKITVSSIIKGCIIVGSWNDKLEIEIPEARTIVSLDINTLAPQYKSDKQPLCAKGQNIDCKVADINKENRKLTVVGVDYELKSPQ